VGASILYGSALEVQGSVRLMETINIC